MQPPQPPAAQRPLRRSRSACQRAADDLAAAETARAHDALDRTVAALTAADRASDPHEPRQGGDR